MRKRLIVLAGTIFGTCLMVYLLGAFAAGSFSILQWSSEQRDIVAVFTGLLLFIIGVPSVMSALDE